MLHLDVISIQGFASVIIRRNDFWNGWIGFARANSTRVEADEDSGQPARLTIERLNASLGAVRVSLIQSVKFTITLISLKYYQVFRHHCTGGIRRALSSRY